MNTLCKMMLVGVLLASRTSFAADAPKSPKTRATVRQETRDANARGELRVGDDPLYPNDRAAARPKSKRKPTAAHPGRAKDVRAEPLPRGSMFT